MPTSTRHSLPSPASSVVPDVPVDIKALADAVDPKLPWVNTTEPAKTMGLIWRNPTTGLVQITDGTSWFPINDTNWAAYTPSWTAIGTAPALGNGTISGSWTRNGRSITVRGNLLMGSTTTYGTGGWRFSLPPSTPAATASPAFTGFPVWIGSAYAFDLGLTNRQGISRIDSGGATISITGDTVSHWGDGSIPHAWATGDYCSWEITYEAAS